MADEKPLYEIDADADTPDPDETPIRDRKVITQPYDLAVDSLVKQIGDGTIFLRPLSERPNFQRRYVWSNKLASRLIESILLNVPIPPCYLSQNDEFELDVIDGQQRLYSLYRFIENQFPLSGLEVLQELNTKRFFELSTKLRRQLETHTLRCILITNQSHPEIKFDVFERLNTNTVPLNAQELRNCVYRGALNSYLKEASEYAPWLDILHRKTPDTRLRDEELILRFFAYELLGLATYRTPLKHWLNDTAKAGRNLSTARIAELRGMWERTISVCLIWFGPQRCFRRNGSRAINRALFDLVANTAKSVSEDRAHAAAVTFRQRYEALAANEEFVDLVSRAVDHKKRTLRRFQMWNEAMQDLF